MREEKKAWKCMGECKREFELGDWECCPGVRHIVAAKTYYLADAPFHDPKHDPEGLVFRSARTHFYAIPEKKLVEASTGQITKTQPAPVTFVQGRYETSDAEEQYFIERSKIDVGYERWFEAYHTPIQKQRIKEQQQRDRESELNRRLKEANELLVAVKARAGKKDIETAGSLSK